MSKFVWVTTWSRVCGIADYSHALFDETKKTLTEQGWDLEIVSLDEFSNEKQLLQKLISLSPKLVHFQHEYGIFGGKTPPAYFFPRLARDLKKNLPGLKLLATAHTVLDREYQYPLTGGAIERLARKLLNRTIMKRLRRLWSEETWAVLDGVIVHSRHLVEAVRASGCPSVEVIPHFVPPLRSLPVKRLGTTKNLIVFGFFSRDKGQDLVIRALSELPSEYRLTLAGGVRRNSDKSYYQECLTMIKRLQLSKRVELTGYVETQDVDRYYAEADLVVVPFRQTSGSGSIVQALSRSKLVLASDLALNREIGEREEGCLTFFVSENINSLRESVERLLSGDSAQLERNVEQMQAASRYARKFQPREIAVLHAKYYREILGR